MALALVFASAITLGTTGIPCDCDIVVQEGESLQEAVDLAMPGGIVCLDAGSWTENVEISKPLRFCGSGAAMTSITGITPGYPSVWVRTLGEEAEPIEVKIENMTIQGTPGECYYDSNTICANGLVVGGYAIAWIDSVEITGHAEYGLWVEDNATASLINSTVSRCGNDGVEVRDNALLHIIDCAIEENAFNGVVASGFGTLDLEECTIERNEHSGIALLGSPSVSVQNCTITENQFVGITQHLLSCPPVGYGESEFFGTITGAENWIPASPDARGNLLGIVCPSNWLLPTGFMRASE